MNNSLQGSMYSTSSSKSSQHSGDSSRKNMGNNKNGGMPIGTGIDGLGGARENMLFGMTKPFSRKSIRI